MASTARRTTRSTSAEEAEEAWQQASKVPELFAVGASLPLSPAFVEAADGVG